MRLLFATHNEHKLNEIRLLINKDLKIISLSDINQFEEIPETAKTLEENAMLKASFIYTKTSTNCFADDSGLEVEALSGNPGVYSARYAGEPKNDERNISKVLAELTGKTNRNAQFKTVLALIYYDKEYMFEGVIKGTITLEKRGLMGFGYDPIFIPDGSINTFAEMTQEEKNKISHRAIAIRKLNNFISNIK